MKILDIIIRLINVKKILKYAVNGKNNCFRTILFVFCFSNAFFST